MCMSLNYRDALTSKSATVRKELCRCRNVTSVRSQEFVCRNEHNVNIPETLSLFLGILAGVLTKASMRVLAGAIPFIRVVNYEETKKKGSPVLYQRSKTFWTVVILDTVDWINHWEKP